MSHHPYILCHIIIQHISRHPNMREAQMCVRREYMYSCTCVCTHIACMYTYVSTHVYADVIKCMGGTHMYSGICLCTHTAYVHTQHMYTHSMYDTCVYTHVLRCHKCVYTRVRRAGVTDRDPSRSGGKSCVCVCVCVHTHTHTHTHNMRKHVCTYMYIGQV